MIRNYKYKHYSILTVAAAILIASLLPANIPNILDQFLWLVYIVIISWLGIGEKTEQADELTELNLSKANRYTMFAAMLAILILSFFSSDETGTDLVTLPSVVFNIVLCGLVMFRSLVFLWYDRTVGKDDEPQEEA